MGATTAIQEPREAKPKVPDYLVYEVVKGKPVYYKGYKDVLNGTKTFEEIMADSKLQSWLKAHLAIRLGSELLKNGYDLTVGELGLNLNKVDKRAADFSVFKEDTWELDAHYSDLPPEVIVEIDVQAECEEIHEMEYVLEKIEDYHRFGVKKVIWIFTRNKKVMYAPANLPWTTFDWEQELEVVEGVHLNVADIVSKRKKTG